MLSLVPMFLLTAFAPVPAAADVLAQSASTPTGMQVPYQVVDQNRLAITPWLDGRFEDEEWDILHRGTDHWTAMQWEPGYLYLGAKVPKGKDLVISIDLRGDGWLVGNDNLELRYVWKDGTPVVDARILDATNRNAPTWSYAPLLAGLIRAAGVEEADGWTVESRIESVDLPDFSLGRTLGIRSDLIESLALTPEPFFPRSLGFAALRWERSKGLPAGIEWSPELKVRKSVPGDSIKIRLNFTKTGDAELKRVELRSEGFAKEATKLLALPFPAFDRKGRAFVDYDTPISADARQGYRLLRARVTSAKGDEAIIQTSFAVADLVDFDVQLPTNLVRSVDSRVIKGAIVVRSNTPGRLDGKFELTVPETWSIARNKDQRLLIYNSRGLQRIPIDLIAPQNASGLIPLGLRVTVGDKVVQKPFMLLIR
jgi:hypothetical protein